MTKKSIKLKLLPKIFGRGVYTIKNRRVFNKTGKKLGFITNINGTEYIYVELKHEGKKYRYSMNEILIWYDEKNKSRDKEWKNKIKSVNAAKSTELLEGFLQFFETDKTITEIAKDLSIDVMALSSEIESICESIGAETPTHKIGNTFYFKDGSNISLDIETNKNSIKEKLPEIAKKIYKPEVKKELPKNDLDRVRKTLGELVGMIDLCNDISESIGGKLELIHGEVISKLKVRKKFLEEEIEKINKALKIAE